MLNRGDFNSYIYIPVKNNEQVKKRSQVCFHLLQRLTEKQLAISKDKEEATNPYSNQRDELNAGESSKHVFYQLDELNEGGKKPKGESTKREYKNHIHITIADTVQIKRHMITSFVTKIREELQTQSCFHLFFKNSVDLYRSQKHTKYFCAYSVTPDQQETHLDVLLKKIEKVLGQFGLTNQYANRICHLSLAYTDINLGPLLEENQLNVGDTFWPDIERIVGDNNLCSSSTEESDQFCIYVNRICIRVGNTVYESRFRNLHDHLNVLQSDESADSSTE
ncbi:U6 snRNA phosphodiesterase, putative [Plasmodium vivax]|uniref:U6 snRNA phosphodiesterase 1 n=6 Tax=Plasmodium vivax TaxID=5855 RepID=A5K882_PLAVS|nr:hypothetical protein, conserved [Plasmodium vivax]KMZ79225.1 hypothetical protein PVIIG_01699 [Plasmodium vivax India VII]KMZ85369.1 hypothetical protein PVBG_02055 [Plasmodium vivax Brazil I]KMZ91246.1 hypothetical protein PVMG_00120 [Plasmodium vivax Mauritania I]KMZ98285.1 hypothetical protein PVNG_03426 [Plasmodium vivax North Korean]EDL44496.1 hypothetical protein, conserved [Plasmodium vivax]|eukprot:XP_001614223.1 hypothetical protein [Plasmodium vivax Sal-1]